MKVVVQRVKKASVHVNDQLIGSIEKGLLVLVGVQVSDTLDDARYLAKKVAQLRVFEDEHEKMNLNLEQVQGAILSISQFTLYGNCDEGNRPSFTKAAKGDVALPLYEAFNQVLIKSYHLPVQTGVFGAHMQIALENDGPVTIIIDSQKSE